jgi:hypothetical protein
MGQGNFWGSDKLFWWYWGFEVRALCLLSRCSTTWDTPHPFLIYFSDRVSYFLPWLIWTAILLFVLPVYLELQMCTTMPRFFVEMGSLIFCPGWPQTMIFPGSAFWVTGITGMSHCAQPNLIIFMNYFQECFFSFNIVKKVLSSKELTWKIKHAMLVH